MKTKINPPHANVDRPLVTLPLLRFVQSMLRDGWRHWEIARETGLSVWTIARIDTDLKVAGTLRVPSVECENGTRSVPTTFEDDAPPDYVATNLRRCSGCGGMVYQWPCLTCEMRALAEPPRPLHRS